MLNSKWKKLSKHYCILTDTHGCLNTQTVIDAVTISPTVVHPAPSIFFYNKYFYYFKNRNFNNVYNLYNKYNFKIYRNKSTVKKKEKKEEGVGGKYQNEHHLSIYVQEFLRVHHRCKRDLSKF